MQAWLDLRIRFLSFNSEVLCRRNIQPHQDEITANHQRSIIITPPQTLRGAAFDSPWYYLLFARNSRAASSKVLLFCIMTIFLFLSSLFSLAPSLPPYELISTYSYLSGTLFLFLGLPSVPFSNFYSSPNEIFSPSLSPELSAFISRFTLHQKRRTKE